MAPTYKRRKLDEARDLALRVAREQAPQHLSGEELEELRAKGSINCLSGPTGDWASITGFEPDPRLHYEVQLYLPSSKCPWIEKFYARILVTRDRNSESVWIIWKPPVPAYDGPYFE
jgi:uncharacterized protein YciU (UPF0263 family)